MYTIDDLMSVVYAQRDKSFEVGEDSSCAESPVTA